MHASQALQTLLSHHTTTFKSGCQIFFQKLNEYPSNKIPMLPQSFCLVKRMPLDDYNLDCFYLKPQNYSNYLNFNDYGSDELHVAKFNIKMRLFEQ